MNVQSERNPILVDQVDMELQLGDFLVRRQPLGPVQAQILVQPAGVARAGDLLAQALLECSLLLADELLRCTVQLADFGIGLGQRSRSDGWDLVVDRHG